VPGTALALKSGGISSAKASVPRRTSARAASVSVIVRKPKARLSSRVCVSSSPTLTVRDM